MPLIPPTIPTMSIDGNGHWEFILPAAALPAGVSNITCSPDGIYIETADGYDLICWAELLDIMVPYRPGLISPNGSRPAWPAITAIYIDDDSPGVIVSPN